MSNIDLVSSSVCSAPAFVSNLTISFSLGLITILLFLDINLVAFSVAH